MRTARPLTKFLIALAVVLPAAAKSKIAPELETVPPGQAVDVIVRFHKPPDNLTLQNFAALGAVEEGSLNIVNAYVFDVAAGQLSLMAADSNVVFISPDRQIQATAFNSGKDYGWITVTGMADPSGALPYDGSGIGIAIIDSGIDDREDLKDDKGHNRVVYKESFVPGDNHTDDKFGHGDHVAGIIAGTGKKSTGNGFDYRIRGIAPAASLINLRVLDDTGMATDSVVVAAIERAIQLQST
jgi:serine protease AprX